MPAKNIATKKNTKALHRNSGMIIISTIVALIAVIVEVRHLVEAQTPTFSNNVASLHAVIGNSNITESHDINIAGGVNQNASNGQAFAGNVTQSGSNNQIIGHQENNSVAGSNDGLNGNGNSNVTLNHNSTTIINIWTPTERFHFPSDGSVTFPASATERMQELQKIAATPEFEEALRPFAALSTYQPNRIALMMIDPRSTNPIPLSYTKLYECAALVADTQGQETLVRIATARQDVRPRWPMKNWPAASWSNSDPQRALVHNAQNWINKYHAEMVQLGILSP